MSDKDKININYVEKTSDFFSGVQKTLVQKPDYQGIGGHGPADHGGHGQHSQTSIGTVGKTVNFRNCEPASGG